MYIGDIISDFYAEVKSSDTVAYTLDKINELHFHQLPIVDEKEYKGLITEEQLIQISDDQLTLKDIKSPSPLIYIFDYQHVYDALQIISIYKTDILPVLNKQMQYIGVITNNDILKSLNSTLDNAENGAIIVLELDARDQSFTHLAHIIESENTKIVNASSRAIPDSNKIEMTIKLNKNNISSVIASLWRFDYEVKATFNDGTDQDELLDRYDHLMNYLDL
ncbi:CBS domain-containing protein [Sphingobacterium hungaricum]